MPIAFDCDEVLAMYVDAFVAFHNEVYGTSLTRDSFPVYSIARVLGIPIEEERRRLDAFHRTPHFERIRPYEDALEAIERLHGKDSLMIITSRQDDIIEPTRAWLDAHFEGKFDAVYFSRYPGSGDRLSKEEICLRNNVTSIVEDSLEHAMACAAAGIKAFLVDRPWNQASLPSGILRVGSLREIAYPNMFR